MSVVASRTGQKSLHIRLHHAAKPAAIGQPRSAPRRRRATYRSALTKSCRARHGVHAHCCCTAAASGWCCRRGSLVLRPALGRRARDPATTLDHVDARANCADPAGIRNRCAIFASQGVGIWAISRGNQTAALSQKGAAMARGTPAQFALRPLLPGGRRRFLAFPLHPSCPDSSRSSNRESCESHGRALAQPSSRRGCRRRRRPRPPAGAVPGGRGRPTRARRPRRRRPTCHCCARWTARPAARPAGGGGTTGWRPCVLCRRARGRSRCVSVRRPSRRMAEGAEGPPVAWEGGVTTGRRAEPRVICHPADRRDPRRVRRLPMGERGPRAVRRRRARPSPEGGGGGARSASAS